MNASARLAVASVLLVCAATAHARPDRTGSVYLGAAYQKIALESDGLYDAVALEDTDTDYSLFAGLRFSRNFALEVDYSRLGEFVYDGGSVTYQGYQVAGLMIAPLDAELELFARGGVGLVDAEQSAPAFDDTSTAFSLGVGVDWTPRYLNALTVRGYMSTRWITVEPLNTDPDDPDRSYDQNLYEYGVGIAYNF